MSENFRPGYRGELHPPLLTNGKLHKGNYLGPRTHVLERVKRGDPPINYSDEVAKAHDLRYSLARTKKDVRDADDKMISLMKKGKEKKLDNPYNLELGLRGIQIKERLEDVGVPGNFFTTWGGPMDTNDKELLTAELKKEEQKGFGKKKRTKRKTTTKRKPNPWLVHVSKVRKQNPKKNYREVLILAKDSYKKIH